MVNKKQNIRTNKNKVTEKKQVKAVKNATRTKTATTKRVKTTIKKTPTKKVAPAKRTTKVTPKTKSKTKTKSKRPTPSKGVEVKENKPANEIVKEKVSTTQKRTGNVYWANNRKIDPTDEKERRQYAVVRDNGKNVEVSKIRGFNDNEKNNERLYELDQKKYSLSKRSGVDKNVYYQRADNKKPLKLEDKQVFDNNSSFKLSSHDLHRVIKHTNADNRKRRKKT